MARKELDIPEVRSHEDPLRGGQDIITLKRITPNRSLGFEGEPIDPQDFPDHPMGDDELAKDIGRTVRKMRRLGSKSPKWTERLSPGLLKKLGKAVGGKALGVVGTALDFKEFYQTMEAPKKKREFREKHGYNLEYGGEV